MKKLCLCFGVWDARFVCFVVVVVVVVVVVFVLLNSHKIAVYCIAVSMV